MGKSSFSFAIVKKHITTPTYIIKQRKRPQEPSLNEKSAFNQQLNAPIVVAALIKNQIFAVPFRLETSDEIHETRKNAPD